MIVKIEVCFDNSSSKIIDDGELEKFIALCRERSDILLPQSKDDILAQKNKGLVKGYIDRNKFVDENWEAM